MTAYGAVVRSVTGPAPHRENGKCTVNCIWREWGVTRGSAAVAGAARVAARQPGSGRKERRWFIYSPSR